MIWLKIGLVLALVAGVVYGVHAYNSAIEDAEASRALSVTLANERDGWIDVAAQQEAAAHRAEAIVKQREADRNRLQKERDDARASLSELRRDPIVRAWSDTELPAAIRQRVRDLSAERAPAKDDKGAPAGKSAGDGAAAPIRRNP